MKRKRKATPEAEVRAMWHSHVRNSPAGQVPVVLGGSCLAWRVAMGTKYNAAGILRHFAATAPVEHWPDWVKRIQAES